MEIVDLPSWKMVIYFSIVFVNVYQRVWIILDIRMVNLGLVYGFGFTMHWFIIVSGILDQRESAQVQAPP